MEIRLKNKDVRALDRNIGNISKEYDKLLGNKNPFAKFSIGNGFYIWTLPGEGWKKLSEASELEADTVRALLEERKRLVASKSNEITAKKLFTTPTDEYVFYRLDGAEPELMLAAWAFTWPAKPTISKLPEAPHPIDVAFVNDGERMVGYMLQLQETGGRWIETSTNSNGVFHFNSAKPGKIIHVKDSRTGKVYDLVVDDTTEVYEFDVTEHADVRVSVAVDGAPKPGEPVKLHYHGRDYSATTAPDGTATIRLALHPGEPVEAEVRSESKSEPIKADGTLIAFSFTTPKEEPAPEPEEEELLPEDEPIIDEPEPEPEQEAEPEITLTILRADGTPMANASVMLEQGVNSPCRFTASEQGVILLSTDLFERGKNIKATITDGQREIEPIDFTLDEGENEYVLQEEKPETGSSLLSRLLMLLLAIGLAVGLWFALCEIMPDAWAYYSEHILKQ